MGPQTWAVCSLLLLPLLAEPTEDSDFYLAGDYLLGGLFTLHANMTGIVHLNYLQVPKCKEYDTKLLGYSLLQAMRFAVQEINSQRRLLPGVQLGYEMVDSCFTSNNIHPVLHFLARDDRLLPVRRDYSSYVPRVVAVIGPDNTEATVTVAHLLSLFLLPQITYSAIGDQLLDKRQFPGVLRTGPGADHHVEALVQLMLHFGWNWVAVLASGDDYGRDNSRLLAERLAPRNICMAFQETLPTPQPHQAGPSPEERRRLQLIVHKLRDSSARVAVVFSPELALHSFFHEVLRHKLTGMVWLASESWAADPVLHSLAGLRRAGTFLGVTARSVPIPGFSDFHARARSPATHGTPPGTTCNQECDACREGTASFGAVLPGLRGAYGVYSAVYAVAHALHSLLGCTETRCSREVVYPWRLLEEIQKVNFTLLGHHVYFNQQGDLPVDLEVAQWLWEPSGTPFRSVAFYDHLKRKLNVTHEVTWHTPNNEIPLSTCSKDCMPGQKKRPVGIHPCCFECVNCDPGTFLNKTAGHFQTNYQLPPGHPQWQFAFRRRHKEDQGAQSRVLARPGRLPQPAPSGKLSLEPDPGLPVSLAQLQKLSFNAVAREAEPEPPKDAVGTQHHAQGKTWALGKRPVDAGEPCRDVKARHSKLAVQLAPCLSLEWSAGSSQRSDRSIRGEEDVARGVKVLHPPSIHPPGLWVSAAGSFKQPPPMGTFFEALPLGSCDITCRPDKAEGNTHNSQLPVGEVPAVGVL
ncbi:taste receptor type 1 member 2 [Erinaceus europaeus]|uniref:Taste receptor type 1 member 2 n=1 Tax=Erinaceus europaeus TaxID=9365 RepID=A0ABM3YBD1_ERIEU|nr:taste receptor type 1 member 2 [Erinaceus europaeus]